jgi:hypothetical protein
MLSSHHDGDTPLGSAAARSDTRGAFRTTRALGAVRMCEKPFRLEAVLAMAHGIR